MRVLEEVCEIIGIYFRKGDSVEIYKFFQLKPSSFQCKAKQTSARAITSGWHIARMKLHLEVLRLAPGQLRCRVVRHIRLHSFCPAGDQRVIKPEESEIWALTTDKTMRDSDPEKID